MIKRTGKAATTSGRIINICVIALLSGFLALYAEYFFEVVHAHNLGISTYGISAGDYTSIAIIMRIIALFALAFAALSALVAKGGRLFRFFDRYRYAIALAILVACVLLELSGSSIGLWANAIPSSSSTGTVFGMSRPIRSDEWLVFTPFAISQNYTGYSPISDVLRATATDVTMTYAQPCWSLATLFRPFLWGYLLLGTAKGLSFFWVARILALLLVTYECTKLWTRRNKTLSAAVAVLFTFSPIVQWWFAVNGTAELFIFGQGVVLCVNALTQASSAKAKLLIALLLAWCMGGYLMILYPAWQVSLFYVFAILALYALVRQWKLQSAKRRVRKLQDVLLIFAALAICLGLVLICVLNSWDIVQATLNTVYPGHRVSTGGGLLFNLFGYGFSIFGTLDTDTFVPNVCEASTIFTLFPLGIILGLYCSVMTRDKLLIALLALETFFLAFTCVGFPEALAKITLLSQVPTLRMQLALGVLDVMLLARSCSLLASRERQTERRLGDISMAFASLAAALVISIACHLSSQTTSSGQGLFFWMLFAALSAVFISLFQWLRKSTDANSRLVLMALISVVGASGLCVNPVQKGITCISENETIQAIESIAAEDGDAVWLADNNVLGQACIMAGAPCVNSVNTYPDIARWNALDPNKEYEDFYNRYSHIDIELTELKSSISLVAFDNFKLMLNADDIEKLDARYFLSRQDLARFSTETVAFNLLHDCGQGLSIYEIHYEQNA